MLSEKIEKEIELNSWELLQSSLLEQNIDFKKHLESKGITDLNMLCYSSQIGHGRVARFIAIANELLEELGYEYIRKYNDPQKKDSMKLKLFKKEQIFEKEISAQVNVTIK